MVDIDKYKACKTNTTGSNKIIEYIFYILLHHKIYTPKYSLAFLYLS